MRALTHDSENVAAPEDGPDAQPAPEAARPLPPIAPVVPDGARPEPDKDVAQDIEIHAESAVDASPDGRPTDGDMVTEGGDGAAGSGGAVSGGSAASEVEPAAPSPDGVDAPSAPEDAASPSRRAPARAPGALPRTIALVASVLVAAGLFVAGRRATPPDGVGLAAADAGALEAGPERSEGEASEAAVAVGLTPLPSPKDPPAAPKGPAVWRVAELRDDPKVTFAEGAVGKRTLTAALTKAGLPSREVHRLLKALEGKKKVDRLRPKDTFVFAVDKEKGRLSAFELATSPEDVWQARDEDGTLTVKKLELSVERRKVAVGFAVTGELHEAVTRAGLDDDAMKRLDDALDGHFELSDLRPGTRIRLVLTELRVEGQLAKYAHVDAAEVRPPSGQGALRVYHFDEDDEPDERRGKDKKAKKHDRPTGFFDAKGHQPYHGGYRSPVPGARISSRFNPQRLHPVLHVVMPHNGIDFAAPTGAKVYAASSGTVLLAGNGGPCGNMVQIEHTGGLVTAYCHLSKFAPGLHAGQHVDTRQLVGLVGATGRVTGPHLHFALKKDGKFIDPMTLKMDGVRVLPARDREAFARARAGLDAALDAIPLPAAPSAVDAGPVAQDEVYDEAPEDGDAGLP